MSEIHDKVDLVLGMKNAYELEGIVDTRDLTELEMCRLAMNIASFAHLLKKVDFDAIVDHLALVHILKSKKEPATARIKTIRGIKCIFLQFVLRERKRYDTE